MGTLASRKVCGSAPFIGKLIMKKPKPIPNAAIRAIDLDPVMDQLWERRGQHGWTKAQIRQISQLYRMFIYLCFKYPKTTIVPTYEVDAFWHQHILNTRSYAKDCQRVFGRFLHHFPHGAPGKNVDIDQYFDRTLELIRKEFYA